MPDNDSVCGDGPVVAPVRDSETCDEVRTLRHGAFWIGVPGLLTLAVVYGYGRYGYGLFLPQLQREFGGSAGVLGAISSGGYVAELLVLVVVARMSGRCSSRVPVVIGGLSASVGMALMAIAHSITVLAIGVALAGTAPGWVWAPYSDAVAAATRPGARRHALSMISAGTTFGVMVAGPAVLLVSDSGWRAIWLAAACFAMLVTAWNFRVLPKSAHRISLDDTSGSPPWRGLLRSRQHRRLLTAAFSVGLVGAVYWSYGGIMVAGAHATASVSAPLFWSLIGVAGVIGTGTGALVAKWGMPTVFVAAQVSTLLSCGILAIGRPSVVLFVAAAALYGSGFMVAGTLVSLWSAQLFPDRPTAGLSVVIIALTVGAAAGPAAFGVLVDLFDLEIVFAVLSIAAAATLWVRPRRMDVDVGRDPLDPQARQP
ncbi:MFS transporter [Nocardia sp. CS682]|uniref:MFS transporter n=1 Tax=Nocardia sp. CS682 TaxID=1047172 RepID=UPI0010754D86|nr:MFS transporter [Nocardia sp. CS682]QBS39366.1 MFS transporter [Nocardia sp. CS682]